ncbi:MAG TPA: NUDIX hydrolase [Candidatus Saccharimonadales bacterium]|nr:NUDIX hydrolase [Candidatus Saccharimonadales bacterium]
MNAISCAKTLLFNNDGQVLVLRRSDTHPKYPLFLDLPGGEVELGEMAEEAVIREIEEETGLAVKGHGATLLGADTHVRKRGDSMTYLLYKMTIDEHQPNIILSWEHIEYMWLNPTELHGFEKAFQEKIDYALQYKLI